MAESRLQWMAFATTDGYSWNLPLLGRRANWSMTDQNDLETLHAGLSQTVAQLCQTDFCHHPDSIRCSANRTIVARSASAVASYACSSLNNLVDSLHAGFWQRRGSQDTWQSVVCTIPGVDPDQSARGKVVVMGDSTSEELSLLLALSAGYRRCEIRSSCSIPDKSHRSFVADGCTLSLQHLWAPGHTCVETISLVRLVNSPQWRASLKQAVAHLLTRAFLLSECRCFMRSSSASTAGTAVDDVSHDPFSKALRQLVRFVSELFPPERTLFIVSGALLSRQELSAPSPNGRRAAMCNERVARWAAEAMAELQALNATALDFVTPTLSCLPLSTQGATWARQCWTQGKHLTCLPNSTEPISIGILNRQHPDSTVVHEDFESLIAGWQKVVPPPAVLAVRAL